MWEGGGGVDSSEYSIREFNEQNVCVITVGSSGTVVYDPA